MTIHLPGSVDYRRATTPHNAIVDQRPRAVATVLDAISACAAIDYASAAGLRVAIQATGHGVAEDLADDTLLADTSRLDHVVVNPQDRTARWVRARCGGRSMPPQNPTDCWPPQDQHLTSVSPATRSAAAWVAHPRFRPGVERTAVGDLHRRRR